ncbi:MAG TPA: MarR family transcriptional regulator [Thalassobaculum sp.]
MQDPEQNVGFLMGDVARLMRRNFNQRAAAHGLSLAQWRALAFLARQQGVNQVTLADRLEIQPITLARLIDRLQEAGLVARRPDPDDRRAFLLYLTDAAQPLIEQMRRYGADTRAAALAGLPGEDRAALLRALQHMKQNLLEAEGAASTADSTGKADWNAEHTA